MGIPVKLEVFEGPLDLLLHLIEKNKVDIYDIPIVEITNQYMEYIRQMQREDLNVRVNFLLWQRRCWILNARCFFQKKSKKTERKKIQDRNWLNRLLQYKMYKYMSYELRDRQVDADLILYKNPTIPEEVLEYVEPVDLDLLLGDLTMVQLKKVFQEVMRRQTDKVDPVRSKFGKIEKEEVSLTDKFLYVRDYLQEHRRFSFRQLLQKQKSKMHVVVTFLAILEMMKLGEIYVEQESTCGEIMIERKGDVV